MDERRIIENIGKTLALFGEKITQIVGEASKVLAENIIPALSTLYEEIPDLTEERKQELITFCENMLNNGWCMFSYLPLVVYKQDLSTVEKADAYITPYCKDNISEIYNKLLENGISDENIANIQACIENGAYKACSALLISEIEHYIVCEYKITDNNPLLKEKAIEKLKNLYDGVAANKIAIFFYLHNHSLYLSVKEVFKEIKNIATVDDTDFPVPSRHCLLHGYTKRQYAEKDCLFLLLLLFGLVEQKDIMEIKNA